MRCEFQLAAGAFRTSATDSFMARAAYHWIGDLEQGLELPQRVKSTLRKVSLAVVFSTDASFDALQMNARATASM